MSASIASRISAAALALTMTIVVLLGAASYLFTRHTLRQQIGERLAAEGMILGSRLEVRLSDINKDVADLASNLLVVNALVDSTGRELYVKPLFMSFHLLERTPCRLSLCDFEGRPIVSNLDAAPLRSYSDRALLEQVIDRGKPLARIEKTAAGASLLLAHPVFYGATGRSEGMLIVEFPLAPVMESYAGKPLEGVVLHLRLAVKSGEIWNCGHRLDTPLGSSFRLDLPEPLNRLSLELTILEEAKGAYAPLVTLALIYLLIGGVVFALTLQTSRLVGRKLTGPLTSLTSIADRVAAEGSPEPVPIMADGQDEIGRLASSFNTMLGRLRESSELLEQRVSDRTRELHEANAQLNREIVERTQAEATSRAYAEQQGVLLREVNHRVKNNLIAIIGMLHREEDRADEEGETEYGDRLRELVGRVSGLLTVHRLLSSAAWNPLPLSGLCEDLLREAIRGLPPSRQVVLQVSASPLLVDSDQAHYLAMILNELATNSIKYGFCDREALRIELAIDEQEGSILLEYRDDGPGYPESVLRGEIPKGRIGFHLLSGLVKKSLRGSIELANHQGAVTRISFPSAMSQAKP